MGWRELCVISLNTKEKKKIVTSITSWTEEGEENTRICNISPFTCIFPIKSAKRMSPKMASAMLNIDSPG